MKCRTILLSLPLLWGFAACDSNSNSDREHRKSNSRTTGTGSGDSSISSSQSRTLPTGNSSTGDSSASTGSETSAGGDTAASSQFSGSWHLGNCMPSSDPSYKAFKYEVNVSGANLQKILQYYSDTACSILTSGTEVQATFTVKGASSALAGAYEIDLSVTMFKVEIGDAAGATLQNTRKMCGKSDWKVGDSINCIQGGTMAEFDIAALKDNRLYLGQTDSTKDGRTAEKRPVTLSTIGLVKK